jgi:tyrosyl-DNA phosphodiesterase 2
MNAPQYAGFASHNTQVRFDRVLLKPSEWTPTSIELLGTEPISPEHPDVFPSDHFGLLCQISRR